jgi:hypothetical protein
MLDYSKGAHIVRDANLHRAAEWLGCRLADAPKELERTLALAVPVPNRALLAFRSGQIGELRDAFAPDGEAEKEIDKLFTEAAEHEAELAPFFEDSSKEKDDLQEDAIGQLSFQHELLKPLNHLPWLVLGLSLFKVWVVPAMTLIFPIVAWVLPYILLKYLYSLPINANQYMEILQHMWAGNLSAPPFGLGENGAPALPSLWTPKSIAQGIFFVMSFAQSMIQPIQNAIHLYKTDQVLRTVGGRLVRLRDIVARLREICEKSKITPFLIHPTLDGLDGADLRQSFFLVKDQPDRLRLVFRDLAKAEILWRISRNRQLQPVRWLRSGLRLRGAVDISLAVAGRDPVPSSFEVEVQGTSHAVITGPNGGGKSSFMRAVLQSVVLGHAYGFAPAAAAAMPRFGWIASGLQLRDTPGVYSMFETEVKFAADTLHRSSSRGPGLVLFDELFHSTNPPDGIRTAERFLKNLWQRADVLSLVSTHVFRLVEEAPKGVVQALCCQATETPDGEIQYSYAVEPGICTVSSVRKVWQRFGLREPLAAAAAPPASNSPTEGE